MTVSMNTKLMLAITTSRIPRGMSYARINGGTLCCVSQPSRDSAEPSDDGFVPSGDGDFATAEVPLLSLLESAIWALYNRMHEQNNWTNKVKYEANRVDQ